LVYTKINTFPNYSITREGTVKNNKNNNILSGTNLSNSGYKFYKVSGKSVGIHRLLALTYVDNKTGLDYEHLFVDHKNGIKSDISIDNLEWVTPKENNIRAGYLQLSKKSKPILVRDYVTGSITEYRTMLSAAKALGLTKDQISLRVNDKRGPILYPELKQYKYLFDKTDWITYDIGIDDILNRYFTNTICYAMDLQTKKVTKFYTMSDLGKFLNYSPMSVSKVFKEKSQLVCLRKTKLQNKEYFLIKLGTEDWINVKDKYKELEKSFPQFVHIAIITNNLLEKVVVGLNPIVSEFNVNKTQLHYNLIKKTKKLYGEKYFLYYSDYLKMVSAT